MLSSEVGPDILDGALHIGSVVLLVSQQVVFFQEVFQCWCSLVNVLDGLIDAVLTHILAWEPEVVAVSWVKRSCVVAVVNGLEGELLVVSDEPGEDMSGWHVEGGCPVVLCRIVGQLNDGWTYLPSSP